MERNLICQGKARQSWNLVNIPMRVVWRGAHKQDGVWIDEPPNSGYGDAIKWWGADNRVKLDLEIFGCFVEGGVSGRRDDPVMTLATALSRLHGWPLHFWLCDTSFGVCLLPGRQACHQYRFCSATGRYASSARRCMKHCQNLFF